MGKRFDKQAKRVKEGLPANKNRQKKKSGKPLGVENDTGTPWGEASLAAAGNLLELESEANRLPEDVEKQLAALPKPMRKEGQGGDGGRRR